MASRKRTLIFICITLVWMGIIFWFSSRTAQESSAQSDRFLEWISRLLFPHQEGIPTDSGNQWIRLATLLIRKAAHAAEYLILGLLLLGCQSEKHLLERRCLTAWILAVCYAATDEFHQYFVPGRACAVTDVLIDSAGAAAGLLIICLISRFRKNRQTMQQT